MYLVSITSFFRKEIHSVISLSYLQMCRGQEQATESPSYPSDPPHFPPPIEILLVSISPQQET